MIKMQIQKIVYSVLSLLIISTLFSGCFDDKPSDEELRKYVINNTRWYSFGTGFSRKDISDSKYIKLKINRTNSIHDGIKYKIFYTYKLVLNESPKKIPKEILKQIVYNECADAIDEKACDDYKLDESGFLGFLAPKIKNFDPSRIESKDVGYVFSSEKNDEVNFIKSENGWIPDPNEN